MRIELTHCVDAAWYRFHEKYKATAITTFRRLSILLNSDGSKDDQINIKKQDNIEINDYMIGAPLVWRELPVDDQLEHALGDQEDELASGMEVTAITTQAEEDEAMGKEEDNDNSPCDDVEYIDKAQGEALATSCMKLTLLKSSQSLIYERIVTCM